MNGPRRIDLGTPVLLEFRGPDAIRFLNGQITQDARAVADGQVSLPSCVTDAKGRLQHRVDVLSPAEGVLWLGEPGGSAEALEGRITRYLIADDVEAVDRTGEYRLAHWLGTAPEAPAGVVARSSARLGEPGVDWWIPAGLETGPGGLPVEGDELEDLRISNGVPAWGAELAAGMLPPEAGLDLTDISYRKGCYIGQEVISRIKSAGKVNRRLARFELPAEAPAGAGDELVSGGDPAGTLTSVSPLARGGRRRALGYLKRGRDVEALQFTAADGQVFSVAIV